VLVESAAAGAAKGGAPAGAAAADGWSDRVGVVHLDGPTGLPALVLVRPDGYVAWAADRPDGAGLRAALRRWCGPVLVSRPSR